MDWANVVKNTTTMPSKVTHLKYEAPVGTSGSTSGNIITEDGLQLKSAPTTILDYLPSTNNPIVLTGTESGGNTTLTYSYSGTATTTGYIGLNGNYSIQPTESKLTISIENGWIKAVDIYDSSQDESYKAVLEPGEGTKTATAETGFTHRFEADGESRTIQIKNNTTSYGAKISKMVITFVEGLPPAPTTPTADLFQAVSSLYGSYDADKAELTFNAQTTGILRIPNYADITGGKTLKDANGLAYTLKEGAELPTRAQVKATTAELAAANAATDWVMVNKTSGTDRLITLPIECLPEDGDLESWSKKLRVIAISDNDVSPEALTINLKMKRIDAPTVNIERTNAYTNPQSYNPATNELTYEKHTPTVYFDVLETYSNKNVGAKYKIDNGNENSFNFLDTQTSAPATVSASVNNNPGYGQLPVKNGTVNEIKVRHTAISTGYTANGNTQSEKKTYTDVNKGGWFVVKTRSVSSNFDPIPAPVVTVSDNVVDLGGGAKGYVTLPEITVTEADDKNDGILLFQISTGFDAEPKDPQGFADWTVVMNGTTNALANTLKQNGFTEGRIFFKEYKAGETSNYSYIDLYKIESTGLTDISYATLTSEDAPIANGSVVTVAGPLYVRGAYVSTNQSAAGYDSYILFVTDKNGNALRINGEYKSGTGFKDIIGSEDKNLVLASVTGVLKGQDKGYPELYLTDTRDYTPLLGKPTPGSEAAPEAETTFSLEKKDFSKLMLFTNFTYKG
ncbi:MAG: hypothetical protein K2G09_07695, partial [Paramuribaculum sp.]|nr:hypothetical protein [Paramuribaculum sp.]